ncbi:hypothetical protein EPYR_01587 [Erwinia pyrifoliae DSM 12163]|nr:hypothetical protein EPYR_01587 [Erwinia pyrifoliae DSM 12163]
MANSLQPELEEIQDKMHIKSSGCCKHQQSIDQGNFSR